MKNIILFGCICVALTSCNTERYIYNPTSFYNPIFTGKGQSNITARYTTGISNYDNGGFGVTYGNMSIPDGNKHNNNGFDIQAAYAISKHFALTSSFSYKREKDFYGFVIDNNGSESVDSSVVRYKRQSWQIGAGYFLPFNNDRSSFSVYGSVGMGINNINDIGLKQSEVYTNFHNSNNFIYSIQPAINLGLNSRITSSIITRITYINNHNIKTDYTTDELVDAGLNNINGLFYAAIGYNAHIFPFKKLPWLKFDEQILFTTKGETQNDMHYARGSNVSTGISIELSKLLKKK
jgi:hypothetical protein